MFLTVQSKSRNTIVQCCSYNFQEKLTQKAHSKERDTPAERFKHEKSGRQFSLILSYHKEPQPEQSLSKRHSNLSPLRQAHSYHKAFAGSV